MTTPDFDVVVVGGGPAGATAARSLAQRGRKVLLLDRAGRIKPCGGAVPPQLLVDFDIPRDVLEAEVSGARMVSPSARTVDMPIPKGFVGMVDRGHFDEWLRERSARSGVVRVSGTFLRLGDSDGSSVELFYREKKKKNGRASADGSSTGGQGDTATNEQCVRARFVIGADGARSAVGRQAVAGADKLKTVYAYHEIIATPAAVASGTDDKVDRTRCDVVYDGELSPDFYSWVFPHGDTISVGTGTAVKGQSIRGSVTALRKRIGLDEAMTVRTEGAPIPMKPLGRWDDGKHVLLCGDAAGVVAPASGEGIFYAMACGDMAAVAVDEALECNSAKPLRHARKRFMKKHGRVFLVLGIMQRFWYHTNARRERFVTMCADPDVQHLTWESYLNKRLVGKDPMAHVRVFFKDLAHLCGIRRATE